MRKTIVFGSILVVLLMFTITCIGQVYQTGQKVNSFDLNIKDHENIPNDIDDVFIIALVSLELFDDARLEGWYGSPIICRPLTISGYAVEIDIVGLGRPSSRHYDRWVGIEFHSSLFLGTGELITCFYQHDRILIQGVAFFSYIVC